MTLLEVESNGQDTDGRDDDINDSNGWEDIMMPDTFPVMSTRMDAEFAGSPKISRHCIKKGVLMPATAAKSPAPVALQYL